MSAITRVRRRSTDGRGIATGQGGQQRHIDRRGVASENVNRKHSSPGQRRPVCRMENDCQKPNSTIRIFRIVRSWVTFQQTAPFTRFVVASSLRKEYAVCVDEPSHGLGIRRTISPNMNSTLHRYWVRATRHSDLAFEHQSDLPVMGAHA